MRTVIKAEYYFKSGYKKIEIAAESDDAPDEWLAINFVLYDPFHANAPGHPDLKFLSPVDKNR